MLANAEMELIRFARGCVTGVILLLCVSPRIAITSSCAAAVLGGLVSVEASEVYPEARRTYNLPSGEASTTLRQFAGLLGRQVLFLSEKVRGEQTNAINGLYTPREALDRMLANSNLVAIEDEASGGFVVSRRQTPAPLAEVGQDKPQPKKDPMNSPTPHGKMRRWLAHLALAATTAATAQQTSDAPATKTQDDELVVLSPFTVNASADAGYGSTMNTSGRLAKAYVDVPQMANVITSELLDDMKRLDTFNALTFVPGVNVSIGTIQELSLRGLVTGSRFVDGFRAPSFGHGNINDIAFTDRVEIIKGPAPGSFGRGDPAGFINYVVKDPTFRRSTDVEVMVGTGNDDTISQRFMLDSNGLLTEDGKTAYRLVAVSSSGAETPEFSEYENHGALLALKRSFTGKGSLSVKTFVSNDTVPGTITPLDVVDPVYQATRRQVIQDLKIPLVELPLLNRNTWLAYDDTHATSRTFSTTAILDYRLGEHWATRQAAQLLQSKSDADHLFNGSYQYAPDGVTALNTPLRWLHEGAYKSEGYQSDFVGQYKIPVIDCAFELLAGGDYSRITSRSADDFQFPEGQPLTSWNPYIELPGWSFNPTEKYYREVKEESSVYGQMEARFMKEKLRLTGSWRKNRSKVDGVNTTDGSTLKTNTRSPLLPAYSVLYKITDELSVYALHSRYIEPPSSVLLYGRVHSSSPLSQLRAVFQPKTDLTEVGVKGNMLSGRLSFSLCAYEMKQRGAPMGVGISIEDHSQSTDGNGQVTFMIPSDNEARGIEFECFAKLSDKLTFTLNGNYIVSSRTRQVWTPVGEDSIITNGEMAANPDTLAGYFNCSFKGNRRDGLVLTAGWKTIFSGWEIGGLQSNPYPHTNTIVDLGITYGYKDRYEFYIKGNNVFERYFVTTGGLGIVYGRKILAGVTARF